MNIEKRYFLLTSRSFIIGLMLLLLNDFYLKYEYSNFLTGKLSDFSGLFIFPFFVSVFVPRPRMVYALTGLFFIFWKFEISQYFIDYVTKFTNLGFRRELDLSDLIALIVLPISYKYFQIKVASEKKNRFSLSTIICTLSIFAFCATSLPRQTIKSDVVVNCSFVLPMTKEVLFERLNYGHKFSDTMSKNLTDTLFYLYFRVPEYQAEATSIAIIKSLNDENTVITINQITEYHIIGKFFEGIKQSNIDGCKNLKTNDLCSIFKKNYIDMISLTNENSFSFYFDNKELMDKYSDEQER